MTSHFSRSLLLISIIAASANASSDNPESKKRRETLTVTIDKGSRTVAPKLELAAISAADNELSKIVLPGFEESESNVKYIVRVPEGSKNIALFVDGEKAYTFERSCMTDDPMWGPMFRYTYMTDIKNVLVAILQVRAEMALNNSTLDVETEVKNRLVAQFNKLAADMCLFGQFALTLPNPETWSYWFGVDRMRVLVGGMYNIGSKIEPRVVKLRF